MKEAGLPGRCDFDAVAAHPKTLVGETTRLRGIHPIGQAFGAGTGACDDLFYPITRVSRRSHEGGRR